jgi:hypothetical protein
MSWLDHAMENLFCLLPNTESPELNGKQNKRVAFSSSAANQVHLFPVHATSVVTLYTIRIT